MGEGIPFGILFFRFAKIKNKKDNAFWRKSKEKSFNNSRVFDLLSIFLLIDVYFHSMEYIKLLETKINFGKSVIPYISRTKG